MNKRSIPQAGLKLFILLHAAHMNPYILQTNKLLSLLHLLSESHKIFLCTSCDFRGFFWTGRIYLTFSFKSVKFNTLHECKCHQSGNNIFSNWGNYMILLEENLIWVTVIIWERKKIINLAYYICKRLEMQTHFIYVLYFKE